MAAVQRAVAGAAKRRPSIHDDFESREEVILKTAIDEFCTTGYDATSINSIAGAVGISAGLLYKHFESKEHLLYRAIAYRYSRDIDAFIRGIEKIDEPWQKLRTFIQMHLQSWKTTPEFNLLFFHETRRPAHKYSGMVGEHARRYVRCLETILADGIASGEFSPDINVRFIRDFMIGGLDHSVWWSAATDRPIDVEGLTDQTMAYLLPNILVQQPKGKRE